MVKEGRAEEYRRGQNVEQRQVARSAEGAAAPARRLGSMRLKQRKKGKGNKHATSCQVSAVGIKGEGRRW